VKPTKQQRRIVVLDVAQLYHDMHYGNQEAVVSFFNAYEGSPSTDFMEHVYSMFELLFAKVARRQRDGHLPHVTFDTLLDFSTDKFLDIVCRPAA
jgi:hypothetical protein